MPAKLSESFTLEEFVFSQTAAREGIDNNPSSEQKEALRALCTTVLQPLRDAIGVPIVVTSGFRSPRLNKTVHGAVDSQHMDGKAADLVCFSMSTKALLKRVLELNLPFDQLIYEGGKKSTWVHISYDEQRNRKQILRATFAAGGGVLYSALTPAEALAL